MILKNIKDEINFRNFNKLKNFNLLFTCLLKEILKLNNTSKKKDCIKILEHLKKNISYKKNLSKNFHIFRVSFYSLKFVNEPYRGEACKLALVHNIFEKKKSYHIEKILDFKTLKLAKILKVNRKKQWENKYISDYYQVLNKNSKIAQTVKCLDKFDNLFSLYKNTNKKIKNLYLEEITDFILPMVKRNLPKLDQYYKKLIEYNYNLINQKILI